MTLIQGTARADARTKNLVKRLKHGEIAIINHRDLDSMAAHSLVECKVAAVVNAAESITGRYPNIGPGILLDAGIPILDHVGESCMEKIQEGCHVEIRDENLILNGETIAQGELLSREQVNQKLEEAKANISVELEKFARNTVDYIVHEKFLLLDSQDMPEPKVQMADRHALIVVRGEGYKRDLETIYSYIRHEKPVLIGVDGGADALMEFGFKPDIIIGDMDSISDRCLQCGAQIIVHAYTDGRAPGLKRVEELGLHADIFKAAGTSEDIAMLMAYEKRAELIVAVGTHFSLVEFLDKGRGGMASTFLTRLRVGSRLVDAKGVGRLYRPGLGTGSIIGIIAAAMLPVIVLISTSPTFRGIFEIIRMYVKLWLRKVSL